MTRLLGRRLVGRRLRLDRRLGYRLLGLRFGGDGRDFARVLLNHAGARAFFERLSFTNQKEYVLWIVEAKKRETREKRLELALSAQMSSLSVNSAAFWRVTITGSIQAL